MLNKSVKWHKAVMVQGKQIKFQFDTGAEANVIPLQVLKKVGLTLIK